MGTSHPSLRAPKGESPGRKPPSNSLITRIAHLHPQFLTASKVLILTDPDRQPARNSTSAFPVFASGFTLTIVSLVVAFVVAYTSRRTFHVGVILSLSPLVVLSVACRLLYLPISLPPAPYPPVSVILHGALNEFARYINRHIVSSRNPFHRLGY